MRWLRGITFGAPQNIQKITFSNLKDFWGGRRGGLGSGFMCPLKTMIVSLKFLRRKNTKTA